MIVKDIHHEEGGHIYHLELEIENEEADRQMLDKLDKGYTILNINGVPTKK